MTDAASGPPNSAAMAAKAPASTSSCASVCSRRTNRTAIAPMPSPSAMSGASGPSTSPRPRVARPREQDAGQLDGLNRRCRDPLERRVAAVAGKAQEQRHEHARERGHEDHVPPGRLAPVQPVRDDLPDEVDDVVDRSLEEDGRDGDREAEESR